MPSSDDAVNFRFTAGPLVLVHTRVLWQLVALGLVAVGLSVAGFGAELLPDTPSGAVDYLALGSFAVLNGLYLAGVRFRR